MTTQLTIRTNYHWRNPLYGYELPAAQRAEFDYLDDDEYMTHEFAHYRGNYIDLAEFEVFHGHPQWFDGSPQNWQGYRSDSYFSGLLIRYSEDCEQYQIATYYS